MTELEVLTLLRRVFDKVTGYDLWSNLDEALLTITAEIENETLGEPF